MSRMIPLPALAAGFITVLVGYTSSAAIIFQAAKSAGATPAELASWLMALGFAMGISCIGLSLRYRMPISTAWSTPGAALLVTSLAGYSMAEAIGAFVFSAVLILLSGVTGWFERAMRHIPLSIAAAMLAGVLLKFGMNVFTAMQTQFGLVLAMFLTYLLFKRYLPRYAVVAVLLVGSGLAAWLGLIRFEALSLTVATPVWTTPVFNWKALVGVGLPLFIVTMASQNIPGVAVLRSSGYTPPVSALVSWTGLLNLLLAPFGCFALNLAAITAAICAGREAHEDPAQRYRASVAAGGFYLLLGLLGGSVGALFAAFPAALVLAIAGIALFGAISSGLALAMREENQREAALITLLVTASGISLAGIGSAFWGLLAGGLAFWLLGAGGQRTKS
ncbi:benzoate/H(+) symporter BenE family transporter [Chitinimonas arctica]|uniref:Benzoate/H(+) symporter BenE family transporter n=1 Tax=Chitinimonas arctica TaxID=2594795 RepID=A0A516SJW7_9NEIS|nr:benzoate/H(+) symporter BenE family transporter [Chitinimonas arctica]QDQ28423.1 benzoate/H(+) symporter BenE family transporter [Chitinimonas arctica]